MRLRCRRNLGVRLPRYTSPMKNIALLIATLIACMALAGCGNKGPLVKPSATPATTPATTPADAEPATDPAATPAATPASEPDPGTPAARH
jgi:predicted small lipoprotein YifL